MVRGSSEWEDQELGTNGPLDRLSLNSFAQAKNKLFLVHARHYTTCTNESIRNQFVRKKGFSPTFQYVSHQLRG